MSIETLDDWNAILGQCCCPMPSCPVPVRRCESIEATVAASGFFDDEGEVWRLFGTRTVSTGWSQTDSDPGRDYSVSASEGTLYEWPDRITGSVGGEGCPEWGGAAAVESCFSIGSLEIDDYDTPGGVRGDLTFSLRRTRANVGGEPIPDDEDEGTWPACTFADTTTETTPPDAPVVTVQYNVSLATAYPTLSGPAVTDTSGDVLGDGVSFAEWLAYARGKLVAELGAAWECATGEECTALYATDPATEPAQPDALAAMTLRLARWRWEIAREHEGSWFRIVWDEVFFPEDEAAEPVVREQDRSWEWTGPGDPEDDGSWLSGWYELAAPEAAGEVRVVNVRFECYRAAKFGGKPQVTGEGYEIPEA